MDKQKNQLRSQLREAFLEIVGALLGGLLVFIAGAGVLFLIGKSDKIGQLDSEIVIFCVVAIAKGLFKKKKKESDETPKPSP